ncbi:unnamed protein product [Pieris brassicae]|uniref:Fucosyltransferase n=2 Tax=Pieris brassicae TaxID=7116 RepID=A0A9P0X5I5_PIEBR|nr:unnamed protein product [Pieris brassicae]
MIENFSQELFDCELATSFEGFYTFQLRYSNIDHVISTQHNFLQEPVRKETEDLLYILIWTNKWHPTVDLEEGQDVFINNKCPYTNCFITANKYYQNENIEKFDAIVFNVSTMQNWRSSNTPKERSPKQKYVFHGMESSYTYPICPIHMDSFFNLTWTYKLDSDIPHPQFQVTDLKGNVVAPKTNVKWDTTKYNITNYEKHLTRKRKAMVWIVDKCNTLNNRLEYAIKLQSIFRYHFLDFDIFGCGMFECPENICYRLIKQDYYFYFVPEDSEGTDYVTKDVIKAYENYAVPIVLGNADYKRFLPEASYINIKTTSNEALVELVKYLINNPPVYQGFHSWRKTYVIKEVTLEKGLCDLCVKLNEWTGISVKRKFRNWWYKESLRDRCIPGGAETFAEVFSYVNETRH